MSLVCRGALFVSLLALSGCRDYDSLTPLAPASAGTIDEGLLGTWDCRENEEAQDPAGLLTFLQFDESQYYVAVDEDVLRAWATVVGEATFLNVQDLRKDVSAAERGYVFLRYSFPAGDSLRLEAVRSDVLDGIEASGNTPLEAIVDALGDPEAFEPLVDCVRHAEGS